MRIPLLILSVLVPFNFAAQAWNSLGHRTVAELAWRKMDAGERRAATRLLRQHPHYQQILVAHTPEGVDTNHWAFLTAAVWLDLIRPAKAGQPPKPEFITRYDRYQHGIGYPFVQPADQGRVSLRNFTLPRTNAETMLSNALVTLRDRKASPHDQAVSLCVVLHLFGDLHQPLHAATLVTKGKPKGHGLGSGFLVRNRRGEVSTLHSYWDSLPGGDLSYPSILALADKLAAAPELQPDRLPEYAQHRTIPAWVQESFRTAVDLGYAPDRVKWVQASAVKSGKVAEADIPAVSAEYARDAHLAMQRRLALAGLRLAEALKQTW